MSRVARRRSPLQPPTAAPLACLFAYTQSLGLERWLARPKRGLPTLGLSLLWLTLAWRGSGRPYHLQSLLQDPLLAALLGLARLPTPETLRRSLAYFPGQALRRAVETTYLAELPRRSGRVWAALDAHQLPSWGRTQSGRLRKGWSGSQNRRVRGYRLYLAVDTATGQVITYLLLRGDPSDHQVTAVLARQVRQLLGRRLAGGLADCGFTSHAAVAALLAARIPFILGFARSAPIRTRLAELTGQQRRWRRERGAIRLGGCSWDPRLQLLALAARSATDRRGPWVYVTSVQGFGPSRLIALYRQRWRVEQAFDELIHGHDLNHRVSTRLAPNRVAIGFRLLARNLALGLQLHQAAPGPVVRQEPLALRTTQVDGLGLFHQLRRTITIRPLVPTRLRRLHLPWSGRTVHLAA